MGKIALWPPGVLGHAVEKKGNLGFIIMDDKKKPKMVANVDDSTPPSKIHIESIALVPKLSAVTKHYYDDTDDQFVSDLKGFFSSMVAVPSAIYLDLMVSFLILTCFFDQCSYSPMLWLFSEPGTGKTRFGNLLTYSSLYGVRITGVKEAHVIRYCENYRSELFFDCTDLAGEMKRGGTVDILLNRFERGAKYMRVQALKAGSYNDIRVYHLYGPTIIATNFGLPEALQSRCLRINMVRTDQMFSESPSPENCLLFKERLLALKLRHAGETLPAVAKLHVSRLGDIVIPLQAACRLVGMAEAWIPELIEDQLECAKVVHRPEETWVAKAFLNAVKTSSINFAANDLIYAEYCKLDPDVSMSSLQVGMKLTQLGVEKIQTGNGRGRRTTLKFLEEFCGRFSIPYDVDNYSGIRDLG